MSYAATSIVPFYKKKNEKRLIFLRARVGQAGDMYRGHFLLLLLLIKSQLAFFRNNWLDKWWFQM